MEIRRCFEVLELDRDATIEDARQAYKDLVSVWHPDRFGNNPRLKRKAERKLLELNLAFEKVQSYLSANCDEPEGRKQRDAQPGRENSGDNAFSDGRKDTRDPVEVIAEVGTQALLHVGSHLYRALRHLVTNKTKST
jgi:DnaJ-class molecular chaperone